MLWFVCEDNIPSFLTAVFYSYYQGEKTDKQTDNFSGITSDKNDVLLGDTFKEFTVDYNLARRVRDGIIKYDPNAYLDTEYVFSSREKDRLNIIYRYLRFLFKVKRRIDERFIAEPCVKRFDEIRFKVTREIARLHGFIRFQELTNGIMYAHYTSDNDVITFITPHFAERFNTEKLILHDIERGKVAFCENGKYEFMRYDGEVELELSGKEELYLELWRKYHNNVNIDSRKNLRLQKAFMPNRYRWFMHENEPQSRNKVSE